MKLLFNDYGIEIFQHEEKYFIRYDAGEIVTKMDEIEISRQDAENAQKGSNCAYDVIIKHQNMKMPK